jgi:hypothetical protein
MNPDKSSIRQQYTTTCHGNGDLHDCNRCSNSAPVRDYHYICTLLLQSFALPFK